MVDIQGQGMQDIKFKGKLGCMGMLLVYGGFGFVFGGWYFLCDFQKDISKEQQISSYFVNMNDILCWYIINNLLCYSWFFYI